MVSYQVDSGNQHEKIFGLSETEVVSVFLENCSNRKDVCLGSIIQVGNRYFNTKAVAKLNGYSINNGTFHGLRLVNSNF